MELNMIILRTQNYSWNVGGNMTTIKNKVNDLTTDNDRNPIEIITGTRYTAVEGYEVNAWYMREWAGVDPENGDPLWYMDEVDENGNVTGRTTTNSYKQADTYNQCGDEHPNYFSEKNTRVCERDY